MKENVILTRESAQDIYAMSGIDVEKVFDVQYILPLTGKESKIKVIVNEDGTKYLKKVK